MTTFEGSHDGKGMRVGIVCSRFNEFIVTALLNGAKHFVFVQGAAGVFEPREVELGFEGPKQVLIVKGLAAGESVVSENTLLGTTAVGEIMRYRLPNCAPCKIGLSSAASAKCQVWSMWWPWAVRSSNTKCSPI